jgi:hypothetical protein
MRARTGARGTPPRRATAASVAGFALARSLSLAACALSRSIVVATRMASALFVGAGTTRRDGCTHEHSTYTNIGPQANQDTCMSDNTGAWPQKCNRQSLWKMRSAEQRFGHRGSAASRRSAKKPGNSCHN